VNNKCIFIKPFSLCILKSVDLIALHTAYSLSDFVNIEILINFYIFNQYNL